VTPAQIYHPAFYPCSSVASLLFNLCRKAPIRRGPADRESRVLRNPLFSQLAVAGGKDLGILAPTRFTP
jgi:hypothetical protein